MKPILSAALAASAMVCNNASAQFVKGNEAVSTTGARTVVVTPPVPRSAGKVCPADANCHAGAWHMVETSAGLVECTEPSARLTTCRASSYGARKLPRLWIVRSGGTWKWCQYPDLTSKCVDMFAKFPANLPYDAIQ